MPFLLALVVPAIVAASFGAMMFYGRISDVYLGVMTLVFTLILNRFMNAIAGDVYKIGNARLGGFNGIPAFPTLNVPGKTEHGDLRDRVLYVVIVCLLGTYLIARWILASAFGRALIGIRENELRMELSGYNVPAYKTAIFAVAGALAGLAGCLFANWAEIVTPSVFGLGQTAEVLIWVIVGGLGTLIGPVIAAVTLGSLKLALGHQTTIDNSLILGAILILVVLLIPRGFAPTVVAWRRRLAQSQVNRRQARQTPAPHCASGNQSVSEPVVETHELMVRYGGLLAVDHVNFMLRERELRCLIGPNGAGRVPSSNRLLVNSRGNY